MIIDTLTDTLFAQGEISDPNFDYTYPSIAANANGDFMITYNRSGPVGPGGDVSAFAEIWHGNGAECDAPLLLQAGLVGNYQLGSPNRWGDYSWAQLDPNNPNDFWAFVEYPIAPSAAGRSRWGTQIVEVSLPEPRVARTVGHRPRRSRLLAPPQAYVNAAPRADHRPRSGWRGLRSCDVKTRMLQSSRNCSTCLRLHEQGCG
jgi:hypothetical protein